jgi:hypothetical protein
MSSSTNSSNDFWQSQLADIDFSSLPEETSQPEITLSEEKNDNAIVPYEERPPITMHDSLLVMAMLATVLRQVRANPMLIRNAIIIAELGDGNHRLFIPHNLDRKTVQHLTEVASYFNSILEDGNDEDA